MLTIALQFNSFGHTRTYLRSNSQILKMIRIVVDGSWSTWSDWGSCDCDTQKQTRTSTCGALFGGACVGPPSGTEGETRTESQSCICPGIHGLTICVQKY